MAIFTALLLLLLLLETCTSSASSVPPIAPYHLASLSELFFLPNNTGNAKEAFGYCKSVGAVLASQQVLRNSPCFVDVLYHSARSICACCVHPL